MIIDLGYLEIFSLFLFFIGLFTTYILYYSITKRFEKYLNIKPIASSIMFYTILVLVAAFIFISIGEKAGFLLLGISGISILIGTVYFYYSKKKKVF